MKILTSIDDQIIVQFSKDEFEFLKQGMRNTIDYSIASHHHPSVGPTMTFRYGNQVFKKTAEDLAFEDYRGPFIPD